MRNARVSVAVVWMVLCALLGAWACSGSSSGANGADGGGGACVPGQQTSCACPSGASGSQTCDPSGAKYGACQCSSGSDGGAPDSTLPTDGSASDTGPTGSDTGMTDGATSDGATGDGPAGDGAGQPTLVASGQNQPHGIAVDTTNVYWTNLGGNTVASCPLSGCAGTPTVLASGQTGAWGITVVSGNVIWTDYGGNAVMQCAAGGCSGNPTVIGTGPHPQGVAANFVAYQGTDGGDGFVGTATGQPNPYGVAYDSVNQVAYWTNNVAVTGDVMSYAVVSNHVAVVAPGQNGPAFVAVDKNGSVYWTNTNGGTVLKRTADSSCGAGVQTVLASGQGGPLGIAVDANNAYWTNSTDGTIAGCSTSGCGGNPAVLASGQSAPTMIAVDSTNLYWTNSGGGTVMKLAVPSLPQPDAGTSVPAGCPASRPDGGACSSNGLFCEYGSDPNLECNSEVQCTCGAWQNVAPNADPDCPTPAADGGAGCPATYGAGVGTPCSQQGLLCGYPGQGMCQCTRNNTKSAYVWACDLPVSGDAGAGDAGCPMPRPHLGSACTGAAFCDYGICYASTFVDFVAVSCVDGGWAQASGSPAYCSGQP